MVTESECHARHREVWARIWWIVGTLITVGIALASATVASQVKNGERIAATTERVAVLEATQKNVTDLLKEIRQDVKDLKERR